MTAAPPPRKQKLYCFVDETGQDTKGVLFIVAVVVTAADVDVLREALEEIERASGKGRRKWLGSNDRRRLAYVEGVIASPLLRDLVRYSRFTGQRDYRHATTLATAKAILEKARGEYEANVFIDGLARSERHAVGAGLRSLRVRVKKVRGLTDEADPLIRLADAMAGFIRDYVEGDETAAELFRRAVKAGVLRESA